MASNRHGDELGQTWRAILPCFIAIHDDEDTLKCLDTVSEVATANRLLEAPANYPVRDNRKSTERA